MTDIQKLFYPVLTRRTSYRTKSNGDYYSDYKSYHEEIESDCQSRCVYCDISLVEIGGEGMQLDHFKPQSIPKFVQLKNDPTNLVLSCNKCNRLKSDHWPADVSSNATYTGNSGFVDPFKEDRKDFFEIEKTGNIKDKIPPSKYIIQLLKLDRMAKVQVRRKRILSAEVLFVMDKIQNKIETLKDMKSDQSISRDKIFQQVDVLYESICILNGML